MRQGDEKGEIEEGIGVGWGDEMRWDIHGRDSYVLNIVQGFVLV